MASCEHLLCARQSAEAGAGTELGEDHITQRPTYIKAS